ncbi:methylisocitrate lyase [Aquibacillus halophilus]|uniref:Methylisocitrate lyase n=1 Tax=Aquibacillus halophilus TaxID=930132 RepID=A0A6A8D7F0_9BACI|nr:methylisocitrate lyase [Aquibacillus halophilus]
MTWLVEDERTQKELAEQFLKQVESKSILKIPGTHDGMAALVAKQTGFEALYLSGAAYTASRGLPDLGIVTSDEVTQRARDLIRATQLPLLVDIDTGYGGILNVARTAKEMVEARVAAVQIEDQELPKKCGHLNGKKLISTEEMMAKIKTIKQVAPSLVIIARTDAKGVEGIEEAIYRAQNYLEAGADAIFPEALQTEEEFQYFSEKVKAPLLANMTEFGRTPYYTAEQFEGFGYSMVIYPVSSLRMAAKAYEKAFKEIFEKGTQKGVLDDMQTRSELYETISYYDYEELDEKIARTVLPEENSND